MKFLPELIDSDNEVSNTNTESDSEYELYKMENSEGETDSDHEQADRDVLSEEQNDEFEEFDIQDTIFEQLFSEDLLYG